MLVAACVLASFWEEESFLKRRPRARAWVNGGPKCCALGRRGGRTRRGWGRRATQLGPAHVPHVPAHAVFIHPRPHSPSRFQCSHIAPAAFAHPAHRLPARTRASQVEEGEGDGGGRCWRSARRSSHSSGGRWPSCRAGSAGTLPPTPTRRTLIPCPRTQNHSPPFSFQIKLPVLPGPRTGRR